MGSLTTITTRNQNSGIKIEDLNVNGIIIRDNKTLSNYIFKTYRCKQFVFVIHDRLEKELRFQTLHHQFPPIFHGALQILRVKSTSVKNEIVAILIIIEHIFARVVFR